MEFVFDQLINLIYFLMMIIIENFLKIWFGPKYDLDFLHFIIQLRVNFRFNQLYFLNFIAT